MKKRPREPRFTEKIAAKFSGWKEKIVQYNFKWIHKKAASSEKEIGFLVSVKPISFRKPLWLIFFQLILVYLIIGQIYPLHIYVAKYIGWFVDFFQLKQIFKLEFPSPDFYAKTAHYTMLILLGYNGSIILYKIFCGAMSKILYYVDSHSIMIIEHRIFFHRLHWIELKKSSAAYSFTQNPIGNLFNLGSITFFWGLNEIATVSSVSHFRYLMDCLRWMPQREEAMEMSS